MENKEIDMKKEHYEKLDEIDLKMERVCVLQRLLGKRIFEKYCDMTVGGEGDENDKEEYSESFQLSDQIEDNLKEIRNTISGILKDADVR